ncbi:MAG: prepilin-type N-terminal cleavage/methylation domain-containing protein [Acidobacteria bacterium]|nr:MAG: prepilin-type N-terminal cleavage/methylation domain-containing protein [Acidobacteriota bacterium]REK01984.1 MAG: prepilin-type N-terminal cleavage/methylation domain-containing protein [Acidobacteriota bacterium]REK14941.1 MAG: prepilin-type N-terminal cleavage/methylation domain-containing protein [Acidobacteriota bacterium]REK45655.1 MAG: prepilin-type N-terminal cleavage/methylation domain-containing protein [Acidobacteriota bacterium]
MKRNNKLSQRGFSVLEMIIVVVIISILVVFAVAQFGNASTVFETQNVARELKVNLERARFDSVKRRPDNVVDMSRVILVDTDTITVSIDLDQDGVLENTETRTIDFSGRNNVKIVGAGISYPVTIVFDRRGHVTATNSIGDEIDPVFIVCDNCSSFEDAVSPTSYYVRLSPTGTVSMFDNGETPSTAQDPVVSTINTNTAIEPLVSTAPGAIDLTGVTGVPTPFPTPTATPTATPTQTPFPTPTPTPVGSPSPNPTPTATPPPTPTPTPSPTPVACTKNERPAVTGCVCMPPMSLNGSGRCK